MLGMAKSNIDGKLLKLDNLEEKIAKEVYKLQEEMEKMEEEIDHYECLDDLEDRSEMTKDYLVKMIERYTKRRDFMKKKVTEISFNLETNKDTMELSSTWTSLTSLEETLRRHAGNVFEIQEYLNTKGRQAEYESFRRECYTLMHNLNETLLDSQ